MLKVPKSKQRKFLDRWIGAIVKNKKNTALGVKKHIVKHAREIFEKNPRLWAASMRNLVEIYERMHEITPKLSTQIERFENKYNRNHSRYTPPPNK